MVADMTDKPGDLVERLRADLQQIVTLANADMLDQDFHNSNKVWHIARNLLAALSRAQQPDTVTEENLRELIAQACEEEVGDARAEMVRSGEWDRAFPTEAKIIFRVLTAALAVKGKP